MQMSFNRLPLFKFEDLMMNPEIWQKNEHALVLT